MSLGIRYSLPVDHVYWNYGDNLGSAEDAWDIVWGVVSCWSSHFDRAVKLWNEDSGSAVVEG